MALLNSPVDDEEARRKYMNEFKAMNSSQVMSYQWPTDHMPPQSHNLEDDWVPMDYPAIPLEKTPPINSVAGSRKFNILPFESDGFTSAVDAQRAGAGAPGLCGLGLTRDKSKFSNEPSSQTQMAPPISNSNSVGSTRIGTSFAEISPDINDGAKGIAGMMFKVAGVQLLSGTMKEEERWRDVYRACLPSGSSDPYEDGQNLDSALSGRILSDKVSLCEEGESVNESLVTNIENSPTLLAIRDQPALQDALVAINDGSLSPSEWIHFCDAVRDIVKWNEFAM